MESDFSRLPLKVIIYIASQCMENDNFDFNTPYYNLDENRKILDESSVWASMSHSNNRDVEFISKFIIINHSLLTAGDETWKSNLAKFEIPKLKSFKVDYEFWGPATLTEIYKTDWESYDKNWISSAMQSEYIEGDWSYWDGDYQRYESDDFDITDFRVNYVDNKDYEVNENILSKLIIENTNNLLDNLSKDDLVKLRNMINERLSS